MGLTRRGSYAGSGEGKGLVSGTHTKRVTTQQGRHNTHAQGCVGKGTTRWNECMFDHGKRPSSWHTTDTSAQQVLKELLVCTGVKELVESSKFDGFTSGLLQSKEGI